LSHTNSLGTWGRTRPNSSTKAWVSAEADHPPLKRPACPGPTSRPPRRKRPALPPPPPTPLRHTRLGPPAPTTARSSRAASTHHPGPGRRSFAPRPGFFERIRRIGSAQFIAGSLPPPSQPMQAPPQGVLAQIIASLAQVGQQQGHRPLGGLLAELVRIGRQER